MTRCYRTGCEIEGKWQVCMRAWAQGVIDRSKGGPLLMQTPLIVCDHHKADPGPVGDMFPEETRERIQQALAANGKVPLDFGSAEYVFAELTPERSALIAQGAFQQLGNPPELEAGLKKPEPPQFAKTIEEQTIDGMWRVYEHHTIPHHVPADDFGRGVAREAYLSGAVAIVMLWKKLEELGEERRRAALQRWFEELTAVALAQAKPVGGKQ